jgi:hypothetical protein
MMNFIKEGISKAVDIWLKTRNLEIFERRMRELVVMYEEINSRQFKGADNDR